MAQEAFSAVVAWIFTAVSWFGTVIPLHLPLTVALMACLIHAPFYFGQRVRNRYINLLTADYGRASVVVVIATLNVFGWILLAAATALMLIAEIRGRHWLGAIAAFGLAAVIFIFSIGSLVLIVQKRPLGALSDLLNRRRLEDRGNPEQLFHRIERYAFWLEFTGLALEFWELHSA